MSTAKRGQALLLVLVLTSLVFATLNVLKPGGQTTLVTRENLKETSYGDYPTNIESLLTENSLVDTRSGLVLNLQPDMQVIDKDEYYEIYSLSNPAESFVLLTSASSVFESSYEAFENFRGLKERLSYRLGESELKTSLFDFAGDIAPVEVDGKVALLEKERVRVTGAKELNASFINLSLNFRAVSIGMVSEAEVDTQKLYDLLNNLNDLSYTGTTNPESLELTEERTFRGVKLKLPKGFEEVEVSERARVYRPPACTNDPLYGSGIIVLEDDSLTDSNEFMALDNTFITSKDDYLKAFDLKDRSIYTSALSDEKEKSLNNTTFKNQEFKLTLTPVSSGEISTAKPVELNASVYSRLNDYDKTINIILYGIPSVSYAPLKMAAERILKS